MVVFQNTGTPIQTPKYYTLYYKGPQNGTRFSGNPHIQFRGSTGAPPSNQRQKDMLTTWFRVSACKILSRSPTKVRRFKVNVDASLLSPLSLTGIEIGIGILR